ncbi:hemerythrin domain-containing protein [Sphaerisporangium album]|uniref:Hemerythrin domain-containing protein n=1 Tax=Sphaerisporangium album TaxID=509200 RepID=A0A367FG15_9ACTN|nr:hemerythrin domain-containing protein [Sphaerisporangium album]RCG28605.1 hemerythrin domain-containing protein [Sphaerisporangium album]
MTSNTSRLDMSMMLAVHDALRRDAERIARITARADDDPRRVLSTAAGWEMFKGYLRVHHTTEDDTVWPVMRRVLAGRADDLALLDAMEAEHGAVDPLLDAIDAALADRDSGHERLGGLADGLVMVLTTHLRHEEAEALPLVDATMTEEQWRRFGEEHRARIGSGAPRYLPWVLDGMDAAATAAILARMPEGLRAAYEDEWRPAYAGLDLWGAPGRPVTRESPGEAAAS